MIYSKSNAMYKLSTRTRKKLNIIIESMGAKILEL